MDTVITSGATVGSMVAGGVVTFLVSLFKPLVPAGRATHLLFIVLSLVGALISLVIDGQINHTSFTLINVLTSLGLVMGTADVLYKQLSLPSGTDAKIQTILSK